MKVLQYLEKVKGFLADNDAKLIAHYVDESIQRIKIPVELLVIV